MNASHPLPFYSNSNLYHFPPYQYSCLSSILPFLHFLFAFFVTFSLFPLHLSRFLSYPLFSFFSFLLLRFIFFYFFFRFTVISKALLSLSLLSRSFPNPLTPSKKFQGVYTFPTFSFQLVFLLFCLVPFL